MSLDGQVLVIACFAVALNLLLWSRGDNVIGLDVELHPKDMLHLDDGRPRLGAGPRPNGAEGMAATALRPGRIGDRYV
jgi:hypothetical protein